MGNMSDLVIGKPGYLVALQTATNIIRDEDGRAYGWVSGPNIAMFKTIAEFEKYVDWHITTLDPDSTVAVSGSSSTLAYCSAYLAQRFRENRKDSDDKTSAKKPRA